MKTYTAILAVAGLAVGGFVIHSAGAQNYKLPEPKVIDAGPPPSDAIVLFDGKGLDNFRMADGTAPKWPLKNGFFQSAQVGGLFSKEEFGDCQLHLEWSEPTPPKGDGQGRGNSGVYLQGRYEIQILDSYNNKTYPDGQCGAYYGHFAPLVNACRKPGEWQTYDIIYHAPLQGTDGKIIPGSFTVLQNGVLIQDHIPIDGAPSTSSPLQGFGKGPLFLQDHGNPVRFRNIWVRNL
jgi:hypothetical protein